MAEPVIVTVPGSKSITNRALLLAAMAEGTSVLRGCMASEDARHFLTCIRELGFTAKECPAGTDGLVKNPDITVTGGGGTIPRRQAEIYVGSAGTAARFLVAMLALSDGEYIVRSSEQMQRRPMQPLIEALRAAGAAVECLEEEGHFPLRLKGIGAGASTERRRFRVNIDQSSQFLSALLIAAGTLAGETVIEVDGTHGLAYVEMTIEMMRQYGVAVETELSGGRVYRIHGGSGYRAREYWIEPDMSAAAYFYALAVMTGSSIAVHGVRREMLQGDTAFLDILEKMGGRLHTEEAAADGLIVSGPVDGRIRGGFSVDMSACSDQALTLAVLAAYADAPVIIKGIGHIRLQESDRITAITENLARAGIRAEASEGSVTVYPGEPHSAELESYDDHRVAMSFALMGLRTEGITIRDRECCRKTFAEYFEVLEEVKDALRE